MKKKHKLENAEKKAKILKVVSNNIIRNCVWHLSLLLCDPVATMFPSLECHCYYRSPAKWKTCKINSLIFISFVRFQTALQVDTFLKFANTACISFLTCYHFQFVPIFFFVSLSTLPTHNLLDFWLLRWFFFQMTNNSWLFNSFNMKCQRKSIGILGYRPSYTTIWVAIAVRNEIVSKHACFIT